MSPLLFLTTALVLGMRHALDPDHLVAVTTLASAERRLWPTARLGLIWGVGHMLPIVLVGLPVLLLQLRIPGALEQIVDLGVGFLLVILGVQTLWRLRRQRERMDHPNHAHGHHAHPQSGGLRRGWITFGFGTIHGLAGSGAIAVLAMTVAPSLPVGVLYLIAFGAGTCVGMFATTLLVAGPALSALSRHAVARLAVRAAAGTASAAVGLFMCYEIFTALGS